jgi:Ras-related protein Rab-8A
MQEVQRYASTNAPAILIGTKADREDKREVSTEEGQQLADELGVPFMETSARNDINVQESFALLSKKIVETYE